MKVPKCPNCGASMLVNKQEDSNGKHHCQCLKCGFEMNVEGTENKRKIRVPFDMNKFKTGKYEVVTRKGKSAEYLREYEQGITSVWIIDGVCTILQNNGKANNLGIETDVDLFLLDDTPEFSEFENELANILYDEGVINKDRSECYELVKKYSERLLSKVKTDEENKV